MKKIRMLLLLLGSVGSLVVAIYCEVKSIPVGTMLGSLVAGIVIPYLLQSIVDLTDNTNWKTSQRKLKRAGLLQKDTIIRISFAYLFRIKIDGKYFLVKSPRTKKYQPVGGAYKFYAEEAAYLRDNIPVENDNRIPVNEITKRDYRLLVKNKDLRKFIRRFNKTTYRENIPDLSREFIEETIFAWSGALRKRGELDNIPALCDYADKLEKASIMTMEDGVMDKNLAAMSKLENKTPVDTETFLKEINSRLAELMK